MPPAPASAAGSSPVVVAVPQSVEPLVSRATVTPQTVTGASASTSASPSADEPPVVVLPPQSFEPLDSTATVTPQTTTGASPSASRGAAPAAVPSSVLVSP